MRTHASARARAGFGRAALATLAFRIAARGVLVGGVLVLAGAAWAMRQVAITGELSASGSSSDAVQYAQGISGAVARAALPIGLGNLILLASVVVLVLGTLRRPASDVSRRVK